jgi:aldehyde dehydrogenase family 7 protein A1
MSLARAKLASKFISRRYTRQLSLRAAAVLSAVDLPISGEEIPGLYDGRWRGTGDAVKSICPTTGEVLASVTTVRAAIRASSAAGVLKRYSVQATPAEFHEAIARTREAYTVLRSVPAPRRGEILRQIRQALSIKVHLPLFAFGPSSNTTA